MVAAEGELSFPSKQQAGYSRTDDNAANDNVFQFWLSNLMNEGLRIGRTKSNDCDSRDRNNGPKFWERSKSKDGMIRDKHGKTEIRREKIACANLMH